MTARDRQALRDAHAWALLCVAAIGFALTVGVWFA